MLIVFPPIGRHYLIAMPLVVKQQLVNMEVRADEIHMLLAIELCCVAVNAAGRYNQAGACEDPRIYFRCFTDFI